MTTVLASLWQLVPGNKIRYASGSGQQELVIGENDRVHLEMRPCYVVIRKVKQTGDSYWDQDEERTVTFYECVNQQVEVIPAEKVSSIMPG